MAVFDPDSVAFLESGCALIIGTVGEDGEPHASRGWGLDVVASDENLVRLLLDADDDTTVERLAAGGAVAVTGTSVRTLRSMQLKGRASRVEPANDEDRARARRFADAFFTDINETDGASLELVERIFPSEFAVCTIIVEERFDQTPGPRAGAPISAATS